MQSNKSKSLADEQRARSYRLFFVLAIVLMVLTNGASQQRPRPKRVEPKKPEQKQDSAADSISGLSPREILDRARNTGTSQERIDLLEKFLASAKGSDL